MRTINLFVVHCSATREDCTLSPEALDVMHRCRGFNGTGYHYYIRKDGTLYLTRSLERIGAHAKGFNAHSIGICYEGGLDCRGRPADTRTPAQRATLRQLVTDLDLSPDLNGNGEIEPEEWIKQCPCFDASREFGESATGAVSTKEHRVTQVFKDTERR